MKIPAILVALLLAAACDDGELAGPAPPDGALRYVALDVGYFHACALTRGGGAYCWGGNSAGMLGDGTHESRSRPTRVDGTRAFRAIDVGAGHSCAVDRGGAAWCWGHNDEGQLGDGTNTPRNVPTQVDGGHVFVAISAGHAHTCALDADGEAWCWGDDSSGQLGNGPPGELPRSNVPVRVVFDGEFEEVRAGFYQSCGIASDRRAWCWGSNSSGQNGDGTQTPRHTPVPVQGDIGFGSVAPGELFVCGIVLENDAVACWGANRWGELGEDPPSEHGAPVEVGVGNAKAVSASSGEHSVGGVRSYACAIRGDDRATCWGGAVRALRSEDSPEPQRLDDDLRFRHIATGPQFICGLRVDGCAYCGGANSSGQLGTGDLQDRDEMSPVAGP